MLDSILNTANQVPDEVWSAIIEVIMAALVVSPVMVGLKKWWKIHSEKVMMATVMLGSLGAAALIYLQTDPRFAPWVIVIQGWLVFATTQPVYFLFIKPLFRRISTWFAGQLEQAAKLNEVKTAAIPKTGIPEAKTVPPTQVESVDNQEFTR